MRNDSAMINYYSKKCHMAIRSLALQVIAFALGCMALASCGDTQSTGDILNDYVQEINDGNDNGNKYKTFNTLGYFAICYNLKNNPENKAKLLLLCNDPDLESMFKENLLKHLDKGEVLTQIIKEKKGLVYAVLCGGLEYHVYFPPEEIYAKYYKQ